MKQGVTTPETGEAVLELQLSGTPDTRWEDAFDLFPAPHVQGASIRFAHSRPEHHDRFIRWSIPEQDIENGWQFVRQATEFANAYLARCAS